MNLLMIALGGALGSVARFLTVSGATRLLGAGFPYGTMLVNVLGSVLMGVAVAVLIDRVDGGVPSRWAPFVMTGFLGGFTTFSAFSLDGYLLLENGRLGAMMTYAVASVVLSLIGLAIGVTIARMWF